MIMIYVNNVEATEIINRIEIIIMPHLIMGDSEFRNFIVIKEIINKTKTEINFAVKL